MTDQKLYAPASHGPPVSVLNAAVVCLRSNVWGKNFSSSTDTQTFENTTYSCARYVDPYRHMQGKLLLSHHPPNPSLCVRPGVARNNIHALFGSHRLVASVSPAVVLA